MSDFKIVGADSRGNLPTRVMTRMRELFGNAKDWSDAAAKSASDAEQTRVAVSAEGERIITEISSVEETVVQYGDAVELSKPLISGWAAEARVASIDAKSSAEKTMLDSTATAADRVQTGKDVVSSKASADASEVSANKSLAGQYVGSRITAGTDLNTMKTPGVYLNHNGSGTLEQNYPKAGFPGILQIFARAAGGVKQFAFFQNATTVGPRGFWVRDETGAGFTPWNFFSNIRWDQVAGRVAYMWNSLTDTEQMIYGDTGNRDVSSVFKIDGGTTYTGAFILRRIGNICFLTMNQVAITGAGANTTYSFTNALPSGFRPSSALRLALAQATANTSGVATVYTDGKVSVLPGTTSALFQQVIWSTNDPWPAALPGV